jgi:soluble lytic murein transglycosylase-like protein
MRKKAILPKILLLAKKKTALLLTIILMVAICKMGFIPESQADPYLRKVKNGVIYYYFPQRGESCAEQFPSHTGRIRVSQSQRPKNRQAPQELEGVIQEASRRYQVPHTLIKAVIRVESNFCPEATSPKGAQGLMQLMPGTAEQFGVSNPYDIQESIMGGARYLSMLLKKFNFQLPLALAAYNAGPKRVEKNQQVPAIKETQGFVRDVCINFLKYGGE